MLLVRRPGYRIDTVLSRGTLKWVTWSHLCGELKLFTYLAYQLFWFLFGFYPCENLDLVFISIPSFSSSKTNFIRISCCVFVVGGFTGLSFIERSNSLLVDSSSHDGLWCFPAWSCSTICCEFNRPKIIEIGVRMKKLCSFSCWLFMQFF